MNIKPKAYRNSLLFLMKVTFVHVMISSLTVVFAHALETHGKGSLSREISLRPGDAYENAISPTVTFIRTEAFQGVQVSGVVTDDTGSPIPGVNVVEKGTTNGTATDVDGRYSLLVGSADAVLVFSFIGYATQEVTVGGRSTIDITMAPDTQTLQEVVVVGYGEKKKATITGAVTSVKSEEILKAPVTNLSNALAGRLPGTVFINRSGEPGNDGSQIRIRGTNTTGNPSALIVIDGIANRTGGLERLNPADIESITVLKDGSAAIYGAQAANGVILVTTKRGKSGKPEIGFNYNYGFNTPTRLPEVGDAVTYATMLNEIRLYQNVPPDQWAEGWEAFKETGEYTVQGLNNPPVKATYSPEDIQKFRDGSSPWTHPNTDWYGAVIKPVSLQDMATLSLSGGSDDGVRYYVSLGKLFEDGVYKNSGTKYKQYSFRSNIDAKVTDWLKVSVDLAGRQENRVYPTRSAGTIFRMLIRGKPTLPAYWPNGLPGPDIENGDNPVVISTPATGYVHDNNYVFNSNLRGQIDIPWVKGLNIVLNAAFDQSFRPIKRFRTPWYLYTWDGDSVDASGTPVVLRSQRGLNTPELQEELERTSGQTSNAYLNYSKDFGPHAFAFMAGVEKQVLKGSQFQAFRNAYISTAVDELFAGTRNTSTNADNNRNLLYNTARLNYFGRINYGFNEKYLLEMVWRYDGSYIFPEDSRWGFFPGVSAGWVISEEDFMQGIGGIDRLKIRGSWGQLGNDRMNSNPRLDEYQFANNFGFGSGYIFNYNVLTTTITQAIFPVANPNITWEVANNTNIGLEGTAFGGKVSFEFDYFNNIRSQMLIARNVSIPRTVGFDPPLQNIGKLRNRGFDFLVSYAGQAGDLNFQAGLNGGYAKNEVLFYDESPVILEWQKITGRPHDTRLMYKAIGVFRDVAHVESTAAKWPGAKPGDLIFEDVSGDGKIDSNDRIRMENNTIPQFQGGFTFDMQYKGFDFNLLFQGATGARSYIRTQSGDFGNFLYDFIDGRWTPENPTANEPRTFNREDEYWISQANTYWFRKTDYLRLKNVQLGYTFPSPLIERISMKSARLYVNAINLFTIDEFKVFDPETDNQDGTVYPQKKTFNVGVNVTF